MDRVVRKGRSLVRGVLELVLGITRIGTDQRQIVSVWF